MNAKNEGYVFGLDIGTRSIVGTVGYRVGTDRFVVVAMETIEHTTRAVIDGQIHDIQTVARTIDMVKDRLENQIHQPLTDVSIAAAGRVLKTKKVRVSIEFPTETKVTSNHLHDLDVMAVEKAYEEMRNDEEDKEKKFFCVGYSPVKYYLNGYPMEMIEMHTANYIEVELIATFLPEEVVDGLYSAIESVDLHVANLTLEPIAAINLAIPEKFRLLNIALVDVGAGTSDISIVRDGTIIAFGMIPLAGDEITEAIAKEYLTDFETAERAKRQCEKEDTIVINDVFRKEIKVTKEDIQNVTKATVDEITSSIAERIIELNGGQTVSAVFIVGGGGKHEGFTKQLAKCLNLPENRVALRGEEVLGTIEFENPEAKKDSTLVTPLGICMNYYEQKNNFIHVTVNDQHVKLYDNGKATVLDACISSGFSKSNLFPMRGNSIKYTVNGEEREAKGQMGEVAFVSMNGKDITLNDLVKEGDSIAIRPSTKGESGSITLGQIPECRDEIVVKLFGRDVLCPKHIEVNGKVENPLYIVKDQDSIEVIDYYSVAGILEFADIDEDTEILLNGREAGKSAKIHSGDEITYRPKPIEKEETPVDPDEEFKKQLEEDPLLQPQKPLPEWMDVSFDTAKLGTDGEVIAGDVEKRKEKQEREKEKKAKEPIVITINGEKVTMPEKENPIFVDVFDVYPFDMSKAGGTRLITRVNGEDTDFTEPLHEGDEVELFWEK